MKNYTICLIALILTQLYWVDALSCVQCGGKGGVQCSAERTETPRDCADNGGGDKCFTQIDSDGKIERGCGAKDSSVTCTIENNCIPTDGEKNNQLICKKCEGSDKNCSQTEMSSNEIKYNEICAEVTTHCIVKVENKLVVRGCATEDAVKQCAANENTCKTCTDVKCNTGIFPTKRINCYQCSGNTCIDVAENSAFSQPCLNYEETDECYTKAESETDMIRGCKSDTENNKCSPSNTEGCSYCSSDKCNNLKYKYDQALKCHQCSSDDPSNDCFKEQTSQEFKNCEKQILYNETQYCYTQVDGSKIQRGCLHDNTELTLDKCKDDDSDICTKCNSPNGCNNKAVSLDFTCIVCRSDLDKNCWNNADTLKGQKCRSNDSSANEGCFHGIWNGVAIRGCLIDASIQNQEVCKDAKNLQCTVCNKTNCNINKSSGAGKIGVQITVLLTVLSIFGIRNKVFFV